MKSSPIEALYPVSPVQEELLCSFRNGLETQSTGQLSCLLKGSIDIQAFQQTWFKIVERHTILRTSFVWERIERPHQVVSREIDEFFEQLDWSNVPVGKRQKLLRKHLSSQRTLISDPSKAPLIRLSLIRMGSDDLLFVWTYHHLLLDERSAARLWNEGIWIYRELKNGRDGSLEAPFSFKEYVAWLRRQESDEAAKYWQAQLAGVDWQSLGDLAAPQGDSPRAAEFKEEVYRPLAKNGPSSCVESWSYSPSAVLGAWALLLRHYKGRDEAVFGISLSRPPTDLASCETAVGPFRNTLPLRLRISPDVSLSAWLERIQSHLECIQQYQHSSISEVRAWCDLPENCKLFDSVVDLTVPPHTLFSSIDSGVELSGFDLTNRTDCDLTLRIAREPDPRLQITYNAASFDVIAVKRLLAQLGGLLMEMESDLGRRVADLSLQTEVERHQLLFELNDSRTDASADNTAGLFEAQVEQRPDAIALGFEDQHVSYQTLNERANQLGHYLQASGLGPDARVCVCAERSVEMIVGILGILKSGAAYVPLDPSYPIERLAFMLEDSQASVLLTEEGLLDELPALWTRVVCLDTDQDQIRLQSDQNPTPRLTRDNLAYVIYTSGSSGQPKGVQIAHHGLLNLVSWHADQYRISSEDRATQLAGVGFDASAWELWPYLLNGASVHLPDEYTRSTPPALQDWLISRQITMSFLPTPLAESVLASDWPESVALRWMLTGGDRLNHYPKDDLPFKVANNYGPTENAVVTTSGLARRYQASDSIPSIGRPISNVQVYVLDGRLNNVPLGRAGELHVGGESLTRGYLNKPDLTAEQLIPNPFDEQGGQRLYCTGDLVRYRQDGQIDFIGRRDLQVKIRGCRIELGEIESILRLHPGVSDAAVVVREDLPGDRRLVAYVICQPAVQRSTDMRHFLHGKLPDYMVPSIFVFLDTLPLTTHGKIDRRSLPRPDEVNQDTDEEFAPPRTVEEGILAALWTEVLGIERIGVKDNFFRIGGDSILAVQIIARANQAGLKLTTKQLFLYPTVAELASVAGLGPTLRAEQDHVVGRVILTPIQRWYFERRLEHPEEYSQALMLEIREEWPALFFESALTQLISHHDSLRLRFEEGPSGWEQFNEAFTEYGPLAEIHLSALCREDRSRTMESVTAQLQRRLDLDVGPLIRAALFSFGSSQPSLLFIVIHHLAVDGVSWRILVEDLHSVCKQLGEGSPIDLPAKTTSFRAWAERLHEYAQSAELEEEAGYWAAISREVTDPLPIDFADGKNSEASVMTLPIALTVDETQTLLQEVPEAYHTEINDALLTALVEGFAEWTGQRRMLIDLEGHGREALFDDVDVARTVGWFTSMFPVCLELPEVNSVEESLKTVKEQLRLIPNHGIGYGLLRYLAEDLEVREQLRVSPQPDVSFNYLGQFDQMLAQSEGFDLAGELAASKSSLPTDRVHLIEVTASIVGRQLHVSFNYSENLHRRSTIEALASAYLNFLRRIIAHCQAGEANGYKASDVSAFGWNQEDLNDIVSAISKQL